MCRALAPATLQTMIVGSHRGRIVNHHTITSKQIQLVQASYRQLMPLSDAAAAVFYGRLFALDPSLRTLFRGDMQAQGRKLTTMLGTVVTQLHQFDRLLPVLAALGARHRGYGVADAQYATLGAALRWTLEQAFGAGFTPELRDAWAAAYALLASSMIGSQQAKL